MIAGLGKVSLGARGGGSRAPLGHRTRRLSRGALPHQQLLRPA